MNGEKKRGLMAAGLGGMLLISVYLGLRLGSAPLSLGDLIAAIRGTDDVAAVILVKLRLPRVLAALLAGCGLSAAGTILQTVTDNDLCAPHIIGVNAGAGLMVMALMCAFPLSWRLQPLAAFGGAVGAAGLVLGIACAGRGVKSKSTVILAGVAVSALLNAGISFLALRFPDALSSYAAFSVGGFAGVSREALTVPALMIGVCFALSLLLAPKMALMCLGDEAARGLGVAVGTLRVVSVLLAAAMSAAVVAFAGLIGFVGLIVPHVVKRLFGGSLRARLVCGAGTGALITVLADLLGRTAFPRSELPAGIFLALLGGPFFIFLLIRKRFGRERM